ncbi:Winged helix-turn-helix DNA-binding domain, partial [Cinara cedri]
MDVTDESPIIKNPSGKYIGSGQRKVVVNLYNALVKRQLENPDSPRLTFRQTIVEISKTTGLGPRTVQTTLSEYKNQGTVSSPNKKRKTPAIVDKIDEFDKNAIRQLIHNFWRRREVPTITKILTAINEDETLPNFKRT